MNVDEEVKGLTVMSWLACHEGWGLMPEATEFMVACLPRAKAMLETVFSAQALAALASRRSAAGSPRERAGDG